MKNSDICPRSSRSNRLAENAFGLGLEVSEMPEARRLMLLSDARQTSPLPENAPLPHRSVFPPDLALRQVPRASEGRGHQIESSSNLGSGWHPWRRTGALGRVPGSRLEAPATGSGAASMKEFVWRRIPHRRVRPDFVVPAL